MCIFQTFQYIRKGFPCLHRPFLGRDRLGAQPLEDTLRRNRRAFFLPNGAFRVHRTCMRDSKKSPKGARPPPPEPCIHPQNVGRSRIFLLSAYIPKKGKKSKKKEEETNVVIRRLVRPSFLFRRETLIPFSCEPDSVPWRQRMEKRPKRLTGSATTGRLHRRRRMHRARIRTFFSFLGRTDHCFFKRTKRVASFLTANPLKGNTNNTHAHAHKCFQ